MKRSRLSPLTHRALAATLLSICFAAQPSSACGPWGISVHFWRPHHPGPDRDSYLAGELGILDRKLDPAYHYVAYRHLAGIESEPMNGNLEALASLFPAPSSDPPPDPYRTWRKARQQIPGVGPPDRFSRSRSVRVLDREYAYYSYFLNCLDDGLLTAAKTLAARIERFGADSREVRAWISAQDDVFSNCNDGESIPAPLDESWDALSRADRDYQIAAAHFYATRYADAAALFAAISRDRTSPWRELSSYLVARALIRDGRYAEAGEQLQTVLADPELDAMHEPARQLQAYAALRGDPESRRGELEERLLATELGAPVRQDLIDYLWLLERAEGPWVRSPGFASWLLAIGDDGVESPLLPGLAHQHWQREPGTSWLIAALVTADSRQADTEPLIDAAAELMTDRTFPGYLTVAYHRARLLARRGRAEEARAVLDPILDKPDQLSPNDHNRLAILRAEVTPDLDDYLRLVTRVPAGMAWGDESDEVYPIDDTTFPYYRAGDPLLPDDAVELLNHGLPAEELLEIVKGDLLPEPLRRRLALVVWTRAILIENDGVALTVAPLVSSLAPELATEMSAFTAAEADDRRFQAAWTLLRYPGLAPVLRWNVGRQTPIDQIDDLRDNGWCKNVLNADPPIRQIIRPRTLQRGSRTTTPWPDFTGEIVLARAETHREEPRLAEALHRVVRATRIGCGGHGEVSRAAFRLLHKRYPSSPWTKKTPYWFD